ncbi:DUF6344 domain-containing protein [Streptomyces sp. NPDC006334]|uniref:DUF6344 domain-containing protein n=1 Tax=Streptomyces sp. NPDC006334 TaxID=3156754 RepID=UPI0033A85BDF
MRENRVMKLWAAVVSAFLALCTALGFATTTAAPAVAQTEPTRNSDETEGAVRANVSVPQATPRPWLPAMSLPPTMKQRIRAEAHGKSPNCRHIPLPEDEQPAEHTEAACDPEEPPPSLSKLVPLQR